MPAREPGLTDAMYCLFLAALAVRNMRYHPAWAEALASRLGIGSPAGGTTLDAPEAGHGVMTDRRDQQSEHASGADVETRPEFEPSDRPPAEPVPAGETADGRPSEPPPGDSGEAALVPPAQAGAERGEGSADARASRWAEPSDRPPAEPEPSGRASANPEPEVVTDPPGVGEDLGQGNDGAWRDGGRPAADVGGDGVSAETPEDAEGPTADGQDARPVRVDPASAEGRSDGDGSRLGDLGSAVTAEAADRRAAEVGGDGADLSSRDGSEPGSDDDAASAPVDKSDPGVLLSKEPAAEAPQNGDHPDSREPDTLRDQVAALQADNALANERLAKLESEIAALTEDVRAGRAAEPGSGAQPTEQSSERKAERAQPGKATTDQARLGRAEHGTQDLSAAQISDRERALGAAYEDAAHPEHERSLPSDTRLALAGTIAGAALGAAADYLPAIPAHTAGYIGSGVSIVIGAIAVRRENRKAGNVRRPEG
jgi:hypothetical protein